MNWPLLIVVLITLVVPLAAFAFVRAADGRATRPHGRARTGTDAANGGWLESTKVAAVRPRVKRALLAGYTHLINRPDWDGDCPGTDRDVRAFSDLLRLHGVTSLALLDKDAGRARLFAAVRDAFDVLQAGDLFILFVSGHGGQTRDKNGDEPDGLDETLCVYDGDVVDDDLWRLFCEAPAGLRILAVFDTCNSQTMARLVPRRTRLTPPRGALVNLRAALLVFAGCADGKSSFGDANGGQLTRALVKSFAPGRTYLEWFLRTREAMPKNKVPQMTAYGDCDTFYTMQALT